MSTPRLKSSIGQNLRTMRLQKQLKQSELAELAGISQQRIAEIERGDHNMTVDTLEAVARALGCDVEDLVRGSPDTS